MQSHAIEIAHVAATARTGLGRFNLYAGIHKALRAVMAECLLAVGRADPTDPQDVTDAGARVCALMDLCVSHVHHENNFVHPAIEARTPGLSADVAHEHLGHLEQIAYLRAAARQSAGQTRRRQRQCVRCDMMLPGPHRQAVNAPRPGLAMEVAGHE